MRGPAVSLQWCVHVSLFLAEENIAERRIPNHPGSENRGRLGLLLRERLF